MTKSNVSEERIGHDIGELAVEPRNSATNPAGHARAIDWIAARFESLGFDVERQTFEIPEQQPPRQGANIIARFRDRSGGTAQVLIGAHFDTVPGSTGADDNATGVAAMLECARVLSESESPVAATFVAFDAEELQPPVEGLHGSTEFVRRLSVEQRPAAAIIFESIGFSSSTIKQSLPGSFRFLFRRAYNALKHHSFRANSLLILSRGPGRSISRKLEQCAAKAEIDLPILPLEVPWWMPLVRNLRRSDHAPFWLAGIPAVMISDTANFRNPHYHQPTDTADTIDTELVAKAAKMVLNFAEVQNTGAARPDQFDS